MKNKTIKLPRKGLSVRAGFEPKTFDEDKRTIEVVFSTGSKGKRGHFVEYFEELSMKKSDVRLERLNKGAPVLNNHARHNGLEGIIGVVEKAFIKNGEGIAVLRFSEREELQGLIADIRSGVIKNISVGYAVHTYKDVSKKGDEIPTFRAIDWEPMEISFVDIPFDMDSQSRTINQNDTYECIIEQKAEENEMLIEAKIRAAVKSAGLNDEVAEDMISRDISPDEIDGEIKRALTTKKEKEAKEEKEKEEKVELETRKALEAKTLKEKEEKEKLESKPPVDVDAERKVAATAERTRINDINLVAKNLGIDADVVAKNVDGETSVDEFRKIAIEIKAKKDQTIRTNNHNVEVPDMEKRELRMKGVENALLHRFKKAKYELTNEGKDFRHSSLVEVARNFLEAEGVSCAGMANNQIAKRALNSSSDFKEILANTANKSLRDSYDMGIQTFQPIVNDIEVDDFKEISRTQLHSGAALTELNEKGEYEHTTLSESAEKYAIGTFGKIIGITRKAIVNDDMGAFTRIPSLMGLKARSLESRLIWAIITSNPLMSDGNALFSAAHGNIGTGVVNVANVNTGMSQMMLQTDLDGELIDLNPSYLVGPSIQAATIKQFLGATSPNQDSEVNPFKSELDPIIERRLDAASALQWYLMANSSMIDMIEVARLRGESGPTLESEEGFETDGVKLKIRYDFGAKVIDHRGFFRSTGA